MNAKTSKRKNQVTKRLSVINTLSNEEKQARIDDLLQTMQARTWHDLETSGKFDKNAKLSFISDDMLIVGCDIGSETHYLRAIDTRGRELSKTPFSFSNDEEGFETAKAWMVELAAVNDKKQIVLGLEPTGHYWFCIATWLISNGISVVQVNPYAVKQTKEIEDNSQLKDDRKDPKVIANLVKDGNYGIPYLPEGIYADLRSLSLLRSQLTENRIRCANRMHRLMTIHFPEYKGAFGKVDGSFALELLMVAPYPEDIVALGEDGIKEIWHKAKLRGRGYSRASEIYRYAQKSAGRTEGSESDKKGLRYFVKELLFLDEELAEIEAAINEKCMEIPHAENILEISGLGQNIVAGIISSMGDIERFDDAKEIQKLSGLNLVACSSGKHNGETKISHRGRKELRTWLFQGAKSVVAHTEEFKLIHEYYTTRTNNPLKKMQSLIVIACKLLRIIFAILKKGIKYDSQKMLDDIKRFENNAIAAA
ncbi:MAG: IS110 family transposase [Butyrivibrio sp.]|nr:IS110 family transposase [Butyrivibrio sp.]